MFKPMERGTGDIGLNVLFFLFLFVHCFGQTSQNQNLKNQNTEPQDCGVKQTKEYQCLVALGSGFVLFVFSFFPGLGVWDLVFFLLFFFFFLMLFQHFFEFCKTIATIAEVLSRNCQ